MPVYEYKCNKCQGTFERILSIANRKEPQTCDCGSDDVERILSRCGFVLRGGDWPSKALRIDRQMAEKNRRLAPRQASKRREEPGVKLIPNVEGERVDNWSEAKKLAASKGKDTESFEPHIRKEKHA